MKKIPLLLLPGTLCDGRLWSHQIEHLADIADPYVIDVGTDKNLATLAQRILAEAPEKFALAGFSFGGILAFELYRQAAQRITRLALINTNARPDTEQGLENKRQQLQLAKLSGLETLLRETLIPLYLAPGRNGDKALVQIIVDMAVAQGFGVLSNQIEALISRSDSRPLLGQVHCPTLVLGGMDDQLCTPECHREMAAGIPGATLRLLENCGHISTLEQPDTVSMAMLEWLSGI